MRDTRHGGWVSRICRRGNDSRHRTEPHLRPERTGALDRPELHVVECDTARVQLRHLSTGKKGWNFGGNSFPQTDQDIPWANPAHYGCRNGDVDQLGQLKGQATIAAENYVYVTEDVTYKDDTADMLGLVGQNAVWVWNPYGKARNGWGTCTDEGFFLDKERTISAAILSVSHTFVVQNYDIGSSRGTLTATKGAIAQKFRERWRRRRHQAMSSRTTMTRGSASWRRQSSCPRLDVIRDQ